MTKAYLKLLAIGLAGGLLATPALAQDGSEEVAARTPEAAQDFLSKFLVRGDWVAQAGHWFNGESFAYLAAEGSGWHEGEATPPADFHAEQNVDAQIVEVVPLGPCKTSVKASAKTLWQVIIGDPEVPIAAHDLTVEIDWSRVNPIKIREGFGARRSGGMDTNGDYWVPVYDPKTKADIIFVIHADKASAERMAFAMNYLQQHCDPTAGSAF